MVKIDYENIRKNHPDLTIIEGTIGNLFDKNKTKIFEAYENPAIDLEELKQMIFYLIEQSKDPKNDKILRDFEDAARDKDTLVRYFTNFILVSADESLRSPDSNRNKRFKSKYF